MSGDQEGRRDRPSLLDLGQEAEAVHPGHLDVADDDVVVGLLDALERLRRGVARVDVDSFEAETQGFGKRFEERRIVVDEEDARSRHAVSPSISTSGSSTVKAAPSPDGLVTEMAPSCSWM